MIIIISPHLLLVLGYTLVFILALSLLFKLLIKRNHTTLHMRKMLVMREYAQKKEHALHAEKSFLKHKKMSLSSLRKEFATNKTYPKELEHPFLVALTGFPELKNTNITVKYEKMFLIMNSLPKISFLWRTQKNRSYIIRVNINKFPFKGPLLQELSFNGQVGGLAHELSHTIAYKKESFLGILAIGIKYLIKKSRSVIEWETDLETIHRGFNLEIQQFILDSTDNNPTVSALYKRNRKNNYLTSTDVKHYVDLLRDNS